MLLADWVNWNCTSVIHGMFLNLDQVWSLSLLNISRPSEWYSIMVHGASAVAATPSPAKRGLRCQTPAASPPGPYIPMRSPNAAKTPESMGKLWSSQSSLGSMDFASPDSVHKLDRTKTALARVGLSWDMSASQVSQSDSPSTSLMDRVCSASQMTMELRSYVDGNGADSTSPPTPMPSSSMATISSSMEVDQQSSQSVQHVVGDLPSSSTAASSNMSQGKGKKTSHMKNRSQSGIQMTMNFDLTLKPGVSDVAKTRKPMLKAARGGKKHTWVFLPSIRRINPSSIVQLGWVLGWGGLL